MSTHVYPITDTILAPAGVEKKRARMFLSWGKRGELNRVVMELAGWLGLLLFEIQQSLHINEERVADRVRHSSQEEGESIDGGHMNPYREYVGGREL